MRGESLEALSRELGGEIGWHALDVTDAASFDAFADAAASGRVIAAEYAREGLIVEPDVSEVFTIELVDEVVQDDGDTTHEVEAATPHDSDEFVIAVVDEN